MNIYIVNYLNDCPQLIFYSAYLNNILCFKYDVITMKFLQCIIKKSFRQIKIFFFKIIN